MDEFKGVSDVRHPQIALIHNRQCPSRNGRAAEMTVIAPDVAAELTEEDGGKECVRARIRKREPEARLVAARPASRQLAFSERPDSQMSVPVEIATARKEGFGDLRHAHSSRSPQAA